MARGPEFPKVRHLALSTSERIPPAGTDAVIVPFEAAQPEPPEPDRAAPEGALPAASTNPALHAGAQAAFDGFHFAALEQIAETVLGAFDGHFAELPALEKVDVLPADWG